VREVEVKPQWVGTGQLTLAAFDDETLDAVLASPGGPVVLTPQSSQALTAGDVSFEVANAMGVQKVDLTLTAGDTLHFNPASWAASELRVSGIPVGSEVRVFVEGHDGTFMERARRAAAEGELDEESGLVFAPPVVLQSLVSGAGGLFVTHPLLGKGLGQVVLAPGSSNAATFKWKEMPGVPGVRRAWTDWHQQRRQHESLRQAGKLAGLAMAVGSGVASGIFWALAATNSAAAEQARKDAVLAGDQSDLSAMQQKWDDHESALRNELGFAVGGGVAAGLSGAGLGITLSFDRIGAKKIADQGDWTMRVAPLPETAAKAAPSP
jgi:hypothetical protein